MTDVPTPSYLAAARRRLLHQIGRRNCPRWCCCECANCLRYHHHIYPVRRSA